MTRVEAEGIAVLWEDLLQRSPLPPRVAGVTGAEYELARLVQGGPVRVIEAPPAETWIWSDLHLRDRGAFEATGRPFPSLRAMEGRMLEAWTNNVSPGDTIVCLGDVAHPSAFEGDALVARLRNCPGTPPPDPRQPRPRPPRRPRGGGFPRPDRGRALRYRPAGRADTHAARPDSVWLRSPARPPSRQGKPGAAAPRRRGRRDRLRATAARLAPRGSPSAPARASPRPGPRARSSDARRARWASLTA